MEPAYSVLLCNQLLSEFQDQIEKWLYSGIKVFWFGKAKDNEVLKQKYTEFVDAYLLQLYEIARNDKRCLVDGKNAKQFVLGVIACGCPAFNAEQYLVEHCESESHIIVQASAGTGKTTVMIDRIMYLLHMHPDLHLSDIYMVTFTNYATEQMNQRLLTVLMQRYKLTKQMRYFFWMEEQSQMQVSTIHSLAYYLLKELGVGNGYTKSLNLRSYKQEKKEIIKSIINDYSDEYNPVSSQIGVSYYKASRIAEEFISKYTKLGNTGEEINQMDWGDAETSKSALFQDLLLTIIGNFDKRYSAVKLQKEAVSVEDLMIDLQLVLSEDVLPEPDFRIKYLFVDEFQDTDSAQIRIICTLIRIFGATVFVVGDVKQSIYRFRGATDSAFETYERILIQNDQRAVLKFSLIKNYRTTHDILQHINKCFITWGNNGLLQYKYPVIPMQKDSGAFRAIYCYRKESLDEEIIKIVTEELSLLKENVKNGKVGVNEKSRVVLLTRTNNQLIYLEKLLKLNKIPAEVRRDGNFFISEAVRDFYLMVSSFMFPNEPKYTFNYLLTPYAGFSDSINLNEMEDINANFDELNDYLGYFLDQTNWEEYYKALRLRPVLSVFKEIVDKENVVQQYVADSKRKKLRLGWSENKINSAVLIEVHQYKADLEKLISILERKFGGEKVSLYDIYNYLKLAIASNRHEEAATIESFADYQSVLCMTVHKAKGLEFDTVILPFTNRQFDTKNKTELLVDIEENAVGWNYESENKNNKGTIRDIRMYNNKYLELKGKEWEAAIKEETRILYVAMTRAIHRLVCIVSNSGNKNTWASLLHESGIKYE